MNTPQIEVTQQGLTVIGLPMPNALTVSFGLFVRFGSTYESDLYSGCAHFIEHMLFKGSQKISAIDLGFAFGDVGIDANAYTTEEITAYYGTVVPKFFPKALDLIFTLLDPAFRSADVESEREVILDEIALYEDDPTAVLFERAFRDLLGDHPAGRPIIGLRDSVRAITPEVLQSSFDRHYVPSQSVLVVTGAVDFDTIRQSVSCNAESHLSGFFGRPGAPVPKIAPPILATKGAHYVKEGLAQSHLALFAPGPSAADDRRYAWDVFATIVGDDLGSKLYWELVHEGLAESASIDIEERHHFGLTVAYAACDPADLVEVERKVRSLLAQALIFSEEDLFRAKEKIKAKVILDAERPYTRMLSIGEQFMANGELEQLCEIIDKIDRVDRDQIEAAYRAFLGDPQSSDSPWIQFQLTPP